MRLVLGRARLLSVCAVWLVGCTVFSSLNGLTGGDGGGPEGSDAMTSVDALDPTGDALSDAGQHDGDAGNHVDAPETAADASDSAVVGMDAAAMDSSHPNEASVADSAPPVDSSTGAEASSVDAGSVYAAAVLSDSPLAYWRVDEASGTVATDISGNGNNATYMGTVTYGQTGALIGDTDTAVQLDGLTGFINVGDNFAFTGNASYTLEIWAQPQNINTSYQRLFSREMPTSPRDGYLVFARVEFAADPSTFSMERWATNANNQCPQTAAITQVWHHFVATYDGSTSRIYLDGALAASQPAPLALNATTASLWIGASAFDSAAYFAGLVDEVAVYGTALSATRIAAHFHASGR